MNVDLQVTVVNRLPRMTANLQRELSAAVRKSAFQVEAGAKQRAPVDTGALKNSIYTVTDRGSGYGRSVADVQSREALFSRRAVMAKRAKTATRNVQQAVKARRAAAHLYKEVRPGRGMEAIIAVGVEYGAHVEYGTHKMGARPFMHPALARVVPTFQAACREAFARALV